MDVGTEKFINIFKYTPILITKEEVEETLRNLNCEEYIIKPFPTTKPSIDMCRAELQAKAIREIKSILFWTNKKRRKEYVDKNLSSEYQQLLTKWEMGKRTFEGNEDKRKRIEDLERKKSYEQAKKVLEEKIAGSEDYVNKKIEEYLNGISLPVNFSIDYEYDYSKGQLLIDLDLPEIENIPQEKASTLSSGKLSIKQKSKKELNEEYAKCVCGLAFFFAGNFSNISPKIQTILISGYTQRLSSKTGNIEDEYIYSIVFERDVFSKLNINNINPIEGLYNFKNVLNLNSIYEMKKIEPLLL